MNRAMVRDTIEGSTMYNHDKELRETAKQELKQAIEKYAALLVDDDFELTKSSAAYHLQYEVDDYLFTNFK